MTCLLAALLGLLLMSLPTSAAWQQDTFVIWPQKADAPQQTAVVSWSDWLVFRDATSGTPGVRYILNEMAASGIRTVWWRTFGGGHALYPSKVPGVTIGNYAGQGADFSSFDSLKEAVDFGHRLGLKVYAWYTPLEEAHAWEDNVRSRYADNHPELWEKNERGDTIKVPSMFCKEYRQYKLDLGRDMLYRYPIDGLVVDLERRGAPIRNSTWGYRDDAIRAFRQKTGRTPTPTDPQWAKFRASWTGQLIHDLAMATRRRPQPATFAVMFPGKSLANALYDIPEILKDTKVDFLAVTAHGKEGWGSPASDLQKLTQDLKSRLKTDVHPIIYSLAGGRKALEPQVKRYQKQKMPELIWFETTYLHVNHYYDLPRKLAVPHQVTLTSPAFDNRQGDRLTILAAGKWSLMLDQKTVATGQPGEQVDVNLPPSTENAHITLTCQLHDTSSTCGIAVQGSHIRTNAAWTSSQGKVITVAQPGIPPFLGK